MSKKAISLLSALLFFALFSCNLGVAAEVRVAQESDQTHSSNERTVNAGPRAQLRFVADLFAPAEGQDEGTLLPQKLSSDQFRWTCFNAAGSCADNLSVQGQVAIFTVPDSLNADETLSITVEHASGASAAVIRIKGIDVQSTDVIEEEIRKPMAKPELPSKPVKAAETKKKEKNKDDDDKPARRGMGKKERRSRSSDKGDDSGGGGRRSRRGRSEKSDSDRSDRYDRSAEERAFGDFLREGGGGSYGGGGGSSGGSGSKVPYSEDGVKPTPVMRCLPQTDDKGVTSVHCVEAKIKELRVRKAAPKKSALAWNPKAQKSVAQKQAKTRGRQLALPKPRSSALPN